LDAYERSLLSAKLAHGDDLADALFSILVPAHTSQRMGNNDGEKESFIFSLKLSNRRCDDPEHCEPRMSRIQPLVFIGGTRMQTLTQWADRGSRPYCICY
jgi:hypothetical protein